MTTRAGTTARSTALILAMTLALAPAVPARAQPAAAEVPAVPGPTACDFYAWTNNELPSITLRAAPADDAPAIGTLPTTGADEAPETDDDYYSVGFQVTEARDGWLHITGANDDNSTKPRPVPAGSGWIRASEARVGIQSARGYARPDPASARLLDLGQDWLTERGAIRQILACDGDWLLLDYALLVDRKFEPLPPSERVTRRAWFRGVCSVEETTCDMRSVDQ